MVMAIASVTVQGEQHVDVGSIKSLEKRYPMDILRAPLTINGVRVWAVVDSGAGVSVCSRAGAKHLGCSPSATRRRVCLADGRRVRGWETEPVTMRMGDKRKTTKLIILEEAPVDFLLGRKDMFDLGVEISGIPSIHPEDTLPERQELEKWTDCSMEWKPEQRVPQHEFTVIVNRINRVLKENVKLPVDTQTDHPMGTVRLETKGEPQFSRQYPLPHASIEAINQQVDKWLSENVIEKCKSVSPWNSPLLAVKKKDPAGQWTKTRVCLDVRALNRCLKTPRNNLPRIPEILERAAKAVMFSELDLRQGYQQMPIAQEDRHKTAFVWDGQQYQFCGAPFGISTVPELFQDLMDTVLLEGGCSKFAIAYLDNVMIFSSSAHEHGEHVSKVIAAFTKHKLKLNLAKSHIAYEAGTILGQEVFGARRGSTYRPSATKVDKLLKMPFPKTGKQVAALLGALNYLRAFIPRYSALCAPFEKLRKQKQVKKTPELELHLKAIKDTLMGAPVLYLPDYSRDFYVETDASGDGVGCALYQVVDGQRRYIQFAASSLKEFQRAYSTTGRELVAILFALKSFEPYLKGHHFQLYTDHRALTFLFESKEASAHLRRYVQILLDFSFDVVHKPGLDIPLADALSRLFSSKMPVPAEETVFVATSDAWTPSEWKQLLHQAAELKEVTDVSEQKEILNETHAANHEGSRALFRRVVQAGYIWGTLRKDCISHTDNCMSCLKFNVGREGFHPLSPVYANVPWSHIAIDLADPNTTSGDGKNYILVVVDICTRFCVIRAIPDKTAETVAGELCHIFATLGIPSVIQSDNGTEFVNKVLKQITKELRISHRLITAYHPQGNAAAETMVRLTKQQLKKHLEGAHHQWAARLPAVQLQLNSRVTRRHKSMPFALMYGRAVHAPYDQSLPMQSEDELLAKFQSICEVVFPAIDEITAASNKKMVDAFAKGHRITGHDTDMRVMIKNTDRQSKLDPIWVGPYSVVQRTTKGAYVLKDTTGELLPRNVAPNHIKVIASTPLQDDKFYEVEAVLDHRGQAPDYEYLVRWRGFNAEHDEWVSPAAFNDHRVVAEYWSRRGIVAGRPKVLKQRSKGYRRGVGAREGTPSKKRQRKHTRSARR